jgi:hypothetical protein
MTLITFSLGVNVWAGSKLKYNIVNNVVCVPKAGLAVSRDILKN